MHTTKFISSFLFAMLMAMLLPASPAQLLKKTPPNPHVSQAFQWNLTSGQLQELSRGRSAGAVLSFPAPSGPSPQMIAAARQRRGLHTGPSQTTNGKGPLLSPAPRTLLSAEPAPAAGPFETQSATGSGISPGKAQPAQTVSPSPNSSAGKLGVMPRPIPCTAAAVADVNGANGSTEMIYLEPGQHYAIHGCGFGSQPGEVYLTGVDRPNKLSSRAPSPQYLGVHSHPGWIQLIPSPGADGHQNQIWTDTEIQVIVDPNVSGFYDDFGDATVLVIPAAGKTQIKSSPGFGFWAARVEQRLSSVPVPASGSVNSKQPSPVVVATPQSWFAPARLVDASGNPVLANLLSPSAASVVLPGYTFAVVRDDNGGRFSGNQDALDLSPSLLELTPGFQVSRVELFTASLSPAICPTGSNFSSSGNWNTATPNKYEADKITVSWQEQSCGQGGVSAYAFDVFVSGPRGIDPQ